MRNSSEFWTVWSYLKWDVERTFHFVEQMWFYHFVERCERFYSIWDRGRWQTDPLAAQDPAPFLFTFHHQLINLSSTLHQLIINFSNTQKSLCQYQGLVSNLSICWQKFDFSLTIIISRLIFPLTASISRQEKDLWWFLQWSFFMTFLFFFHSDLLEYLKDLAPTDGLLLNYLEVHPF